MWMSSFIHTSLLAGSYLVHLFWTIVKHTYPPAIAHKTENKCLLEIHTIVELYEQFSKHIHHIWPVGDLLIPVTLVLCISFNMTSAVIPKFNIQTLGAQRIRGSDLLRPLDEPLIPFSCHSLNFTPPFVFWSWTNRWRLRALLKETSYLYSCLK